MIVPLDQIPNSTGYFVLSLEGAIFSSGGELENSEDVAKKLFKVISACSDLVSVAGGEAIQSISVNYPTYSYVVARSNKKIHVVKRRLESSPPSSDSSSISASIP